MTRVTGTPPGVGGVASGATLDALEFARVLDTVAVHAVSAPGAERLRARRPVADLDLIRRDLTQVAELQALADAGAPVSAERVEAIGGHLERLERAGSVLEGPDLLALAAAGRAARTVARGLQRVADTAPTLAQLGVEPPPSELIEAIERALDPDGRVRDGWSREVDRARRTVRETRAELTRTLERLLRGLDAAADDAQITVRDGRYVVPVPRDARSRLRGIVHGTSGSGATLFVEPEQAVDLGNALAEAEAGEARAVQAVYRALTDGLRPHVRSLSEGHAMCVEVDDACARARYASHVRAAVPTVERAPAALQVVDGRHPLLIADGIDAVPFDLAMARDQLALVVSGPNTGGKTVLLKAVGVLAAMVQAGIVPPVGKGSAFPVVTRLVADVGDRQSIAESLSTFSAHLAVLREALAAAGPAALVLLDEAGSGTDPTEGAALAAAAVHHLTGAGARVVLTTHLGRLKDLADELPGALNGSLAFDGDRLEPTFRLLLGVPGRSYGLVMARRLAIPEDVVAAAESRLSSGERHLDQMLSDLERARREVEARGVELDAAEARVRRDAERLDIRTREADERETALDAARRTGEREAREQARAYLLEARKRVEQALGQARAAVDEATAREARRLVEKGIQEEADALRQLEEATGWRVVRRGGQGEERGGGGSEPPSRSAPKPAMHRVSTLTSYELDLRGMRADEARVALEQAIDAAVIADFPMLHVIHGKGTGALRQVTREVLRHDPRVSGHRMAAPEQGGAGVTLVDLA